MRAERVEPHAASDASSIDASSVDAVLLDVGGVLVLPAPAFVRDGLRAAGLAAPEDDETYRRAHYVGAAAYDRSTDAPETWNAYLAGYADGIGYTGSEHRAAMAALEEVWREPDLWSWRQDGAVDALVRLGHQHRPLGIVSNSDGTIERRLSELAICQLGTGRHVEVRCIVDSAVIGYEKPHPSAFEPAIAAVGVAPERILFVGDTVRNDVDGARAVGLRPVLLDPYDLHPAVDHPRERSLEALVDLLV